MTKQLTAGHRWRRRRLATLVSFLMISAAWKFRGPRESDFDPKPWVDDLQVIFNRRLPEDYAGFEWAMERRRDQLRSAADEAFRALTRSRSEREAAQIVRGFLKQFDDGHVSLRSPARGSGERYYAAEVVSPQTDSLTACRQFGFESADLSSFQLSPADGYKRIAGDYFESGILRSDARRFGLIRIGSFDRRDYGDACRDEWKDFRRTLRTTCGGSCQDEFDNRVWRRLLDTLEATLRQLCRQGIDVLVVDVTGNGGGQSDAWLAIARMLAPQTIAAPAHSLIKNPRTLGYLKRQRNTLFRYFSQERMSESQEEYLRQAICAMDNLMAEWREPCATIGLWDQSALPSGCSHLTTRPLLERALHDRPVPPGFPPRIEELVSEVPRYGRRPSIWNGPLVVLVDGGTASGAELFAGNLQRRAGAIVVGRPTAGAGGGYAGGVQSFRLEKTGWWLNLPNVITYWPDGSVAKAVEPDYPTRWRARGDPSVMARSVVRLLPAITFEERPAREASTELVGKDQKRGP